MQSETRKPRSKFPVCVVFAIAQLSAQTVAESKPQAPANDVWLQTTMDGIKLSRAGQYAGAEVLFRKALLDAGSFSQADYRLWASLSNVAFVASEQGDLATAEKLYKRALELRERFLGDKHNEVASTLNNLGGVIRQSGRFSEADALLRRALEIAESGTEGRLTATILNTLGLTLIDMKETARAEPVLRRSRAMFEKTAGAESLEVAKSATNLANLYRLNNEFLKAETEQRAAIVIMEQQLGPDHPLLVSSLNNLFTILMSQNKADEGEPHLRRALDIGARAIPNSAAYFQVRANWAALEARRGRFAQAAEIMEEVIRLQERLLGPEHPQLGITLTNYSEVLRKLHQNDRAKKVQARANAIAKAFH